MNKIKLKRYNGLFLALKMFTMYVGCWLIPIIIYVYITVVHKIEFPTAVNVVLVILLVGLLFGLMKLEPKLMGRHTKKQVEKLKESGFNPTYTTEYSDEYFVVDETNGKIAVITKQNPIKMQIVDAALVDEISPFVNKYRGNHSTLIGLEIWVSNKKFLFYTYNGVGFRYAHSIDINSPGGQNSIKAAQQLAIRIANAKEIAIRKNKERASQGEILHL